MTTRRQFILGVTSLGVLSVIAAPSFGATQSPQSATAVTRVYGDGQRFVAVAITYPSAVSTADLAGASFAVAGRTVTEVYPASSTDPDDRADSGPVVIVALSETDTDASLAVTPMQAGPGGQGGRPDWNVGDRNISDTIWATPQATVYAPDRIETDAVRNLIVDEFQQHVWNDPETGDTLPYNLFVPADYDPAKTYPLVNFMHDAGACSDDPLFTLKQGLGAISWASPEDQAARPAFVLAPQFAEIVAGDNNTTSSMLDTVINLIKHLTTEYSIDPARLYTTGQSGGGMLSIAMNIKYPDFFAASFLVACQWGADLVAPMAGQKLFILVSQDDSIAFPGQNAITAALEAAGADIARAVWDGRWSADQFQFAFDDLISEGARINYVSFAEGTVIPPGESTEGAAGHRNTWRIAYTIAPIREWILRT
ncbi:MAG: PHB depolymerase family esterase [Paracoccus sp. (in: a-proteobacteria)]|uniref:prolyl oligopeptidase family serine peptidase n=1 Tax=Paracoccus sp. TaxID=267 RepID=UPI0026E0B7D3|nr:PHB depolymerase family esterase [Paracoccus sp. (in: a-proteobacteria)]MDO5622718.1 PHB depolymerase family esterase [Paracoccus sp. (in: a-proteobacteria)]